MWHGHETKRRILETRSTQCSRQFAETRMSLPHHDDNTSSHVVVVFIERKTKSRPVHSVLLRYLNTSDVTKMASQMLLSSTGMRIIDTTTLFQLACLDYYIPYTLISTHCLLSLSPLSLVEEAVPLPSKLRNNCKKSNH